MYEQDMLENIPVLRFIITIKIIVKYIILYMRFRTFMTLEVVTTNLD